MISIIANKLINSTVVRKSFRTRKTGCIFYLFWHGLLAVEKYPAIYMKKNGLLIDCVHLFANCLIKNSKMGQQTDPKMKDKDISNVKIQQG